ncbi:MAG: thiol peroxidase [Spirochaetes bacterium]|nr:thiol peroxidase [Spirochaetota bacterium]
MAKVTLKGNTVNTSGNLPEKGSAAPDFLLTKTDLSDVSLADFKGKKIILNIFPSVDTGTCAMSVRTFNKRASELKNTVVLCVSHDLPFAHARFCGAEGIDKVISLSVMRNRDFGEKYGVTIIDGALKGLLARSVVIIDENSKVTYTQLVPEISQEPDYDDVIRNL